METIIEMNKLNIHIEDLYELVNEELSLSMVNKMVRQVYIAIFFGDKCLMIDKAYDGIFAEDVNGEITEDIDNYFSNLKWLYKSEYGDGRIKANSLVVNIN